MTAPATLAAVEPRSREPSGERLDPRPADPTAFGLGPWPWLVLGLLLVVHPATPGYARTMWPGYLVGVALLVASTLVRRRLLLPRVPTVGVMLVLLSGLIAALVGAQRFAVAPMIPAFATGLAHGVLWLTALAVLPRVEDGEDSSRRARVRLIAILVGVILVQGLAVLGVVEGLAVSGAGAGRALGSLGNPNLLGATVGAAALAVAAFDRWRRRTLLLVPLVLPILLATQSRGAVAAVLAVLVVFGLRRRALPTLLAVGAGVVLLLLVPNPLRDRLSDLDGDHAFTRPMLWSTAASTVIDHPLGIGPGNYRKVFPERAPVEGRPWLVHQRHAVGLTHNAFLTVFTEWGLLAGGVALLLTLWAARRLLARGPPDPLRQGAGLGAGVLFAEMQVNGVEQSPLGFALFLVLLAAALRRCEPTRARPGAVWPVISRACLIVALVGLVGWKQWSTAATADLRLAVDAYANAEDSASERPTLPELEALIERAAGRAPLAAEVHELAFEVHAARLAGLDLAADPEQARVVVDAAAEAMARARALAPSDAELPLKLARFWIRLARRTGEPRFTDFYHRAMTDVLRLDPLAVTARLELAQEWWHAGRPKQCRVVFDELFAIEPDHPGAWWVLGRFEESRGRLEQALYAYVRTEEAVQNARRGKGVAHPRTQAFYDKALEGVDLNAVRRRIHVLRRELYL